jgi:hypothetical protein
MILGTLSEGVFTTDLAVVISLSCQVWFSIKRGNRWGFSLDDLVKLANVAGT